MAVETSTLMLGIAGLVASGVGLWWAVYSHAYTQRVARRWLRRYVHRKQTYACNIPEDIDKGKIAENVLWDASRGVVVKPASLLEGIVKNCSQLPEDDPTWAKGAGTACWAMLVSWTANLTLLKSWRNSESQCIRGALIPYSKETPEYWKTLQEQVESGQEPTGVRGAPGNKGKKTDGVKHLKLDFRHYMPDGVGMAQVHMRELIGWIIAIDDAHTAFSSSVQDGVAWAHMSHASIDLAKGKDDAGNQVWIAHFSAESDEHPYRHNSNVLEASHAGQMLWSSGWTGGAFSNWGTVEVKRSIVEDVRNIGTNQPIQVPPNVTFWYQRQIATPRILNAARHRMGLVLEALVNEIVRIGEKSGVTRNTHDGDAIKSIVLSRYDHKVNLGARRETATEQEDMCDALYKLWSWCAPVLEILVGDYEGKVHFTPLSRCSGRVGKIIGDGFQEVTEWLVYITVMCSTRVVPMWFETSGWQGPQWVNFAGQSL